MIKRVVSGIKSVIADTQKKKSTQIAKEFLLLWIEQRKLPVHYFSRFLYRTKFKNYRDYISTAELTKLYCSDKIQNPFYVDVVENKLLFALLCESNGLPAPRLYGYNSASNFYKNKQKQLITTTSDLLEFFQGLFQHFQVTKLFAKSIRDKGGKGIFMLEKQHLNKQIEEIGAIILNGSFIYQECLEQHYDINEIYENSINTLRFDVYMGEDNIPHLLGAVMRFGQGGNVVDNRSKGGFCVSIDDRNECLIGKGFSQMTFGGKEYQSHPDSNYVFNGFSIPFYAQSRQLALDMSLMYPNKLMGWDIAITPDGPIVIEGNHNTNLTMSEVGYGGYRKHPLVKEMLRATV